LRRRAFVTGASGFVGANLARHLLAEGHEVHVALRAGHKPWRLTEITKEITTHGADVEDVDAMAKAIAGARPDWIFHLAAYGAYPEQRDFERMVATNIRGTANLLAAAQDHGFEAFVNAGTSSEYGYKDHAPSEIEALEPNSHYAVTKAAATHLCTMTAQKLDLPVRTLRLYSAYGPYEEPTRLVPKLIVEGLEGRLPPLANPDIARDYVYVEDVCAAFVLAAATPGQPPGVVYNVGTGVQTPLRDIVAEARRLLALEVEPSWGSMEKRAWDTEVWVADPARIKGALGWTPRHDLDAGLTQTIDWFKLRPGRIDLYRAAQEAPAHS
jgi:dolichol-phosphate mannosyltransferase